MNYKFLSFLFILFFFLGCDNSSEMYLGSWVTLQEGSMDALDIFVRLENESGDVPSGARIKVSTPDNQVIWVNFDSDYNIYRCSIPDNTAGDYIVDIDSHLGDVSQVVPYNKITDKPVLTLLSDATGSNYFSGDSLDSTVKISMVWDEVDNATVYVVTVTTSSYDTIIFSTDQTSYTLDENILNPEESYSISIEAQSITGDVYLNEYNYYSCNSEESSEYFFNTK